MFYRGQLFRALNPVYAHEPLSGRGAALYGGRFNPKGVPALYTALSVITALKEANQVGSLQPTTLVCYEAEIDGVFDGRDDAALQAEGMNAAALAESTWRNQMKADGEAKTQAFARRLIAKGYRALLVKSFAAGTDDTDLNLVLWQWGDSAAARLTLIDDEARLLRAFPQC
jgi:RES domain-containing protein